MDRLRAFVIDIHRRSLWQVMAVYLASSWFVLQVSEHVVERFLLPEWVYGSAVLLLLLGLPIVLATALVRETHPDHNLSTGVLPGDNPTTPETEVVLGPSGAPQPFTATPGREGAADAGAPSGLWSRLRRQLQRSPLRVILTWPRTIAGGVAAFSLLALVGGVLYLQGVPRLSEARGSAADTFEERSWILLADFEAVEEEDRGVALAVREALGVDLQQSEHVNVLNRSQMVGIFQRMALVNPPLDTPLALEVAERFGAGAVITATISRLGPQYVVSGRALQAGTGEELFAIRVAAAEHRLLEAVESLSREVRRRLGETRETIRESRPLPEVTTQSLEALRAYAESERALLAGDADQAGALAAEAVRIDPTFAMAHRLAAVAAFNQGRTSVGREHSARAYELRDHLSDRERWHVEAFYHQIVRMDPRATLELNELILNRYPDDTRAINNMGTTLMTWRADAERTVGWYERAVELSRGDLLQLTNLTEVTGLLGRLDDAEALIDSLEELEATELATRFRVRASLARGDLERAQSLCSTLVAGPPQVVRTADDRELCGSVELAMGQLAAARARLQSVQASYLTGGRVIRAYYVAWSLSLLEELAGDPAAGTRHLAAFLDAIDPGQVGEPERYLLRVHAAVIGLLRGDDQLVAISERLPPYPEPDHWFSRQGNSMIRAAQSAVEGRGHDALEEIRASDVYGENPVQWMLPRALLLARAYELGGDHDSAISELARIVDPGWSSFANPVTLRAVLPELLMRLGNLEASRGNPAAAIGHYKRLLSLWTNADPELRPRIRQLEQAIMGLGSAGSPEASLTPEVQQARVH